MTTEQQSEQINPSGKESKQDKAERQPRPRRLAYKSVLTAVVVGIVVISALITTIPTTKDHQTP